jgi:hypothetical protein
MNPDGSLPLRITFDQDWGAGVQIHAVAGHIRCEIYVPDPTQPVPLDPDDTAIMGMIRAALLEAGSSRGMLAGVHGAYFLWCLAQHVKYTMEAEGPRVQLAGIDLARTLPPRIPGRPVLTAIVVG